MIHRRWRVAHDKLAAKSKPRKPASGRTQLPPIRFPLLPLQEKPGQEQRSQTPTVPAAASVQGAIAPSLAAAPVPATATAAGPAIASAASAEAPAVSPSFLAESVALFRSHPTPWSSGNSMSTIVTDASLCGDHMQSVLHSPYLMQTSCRCRHHHLQRPRYRNSIHPCPRPRYMFQLPHPARNYPVTATPACATPLWLPTFTS